MDVPVKSLEEFIAKDFFGLFSLYSGKEEIVEDIVLMVESLLTNLVLNQGHVTLFNQIGTLCLKAFDENAIIHPFFANEMLLYFALNMTSCCRSMRKWADAGKYFKLSD